MDHVFRLLRLRRAFSKEFKLEVVKLVAEQERYSIFAGLRKRVDRAVFATTPWKRSRTLWVGEERCGRLVPLPGKRNGTPSGNRERIRNISLPLRRLRNYGKRRKRYTTSRRILQISSR